MTTLTRSETATQASSTPAASSKGLTTSGSTPQKVAKAVASAPRIDLEPLYTSLKSVIGDRWESYKEAVSLFILGKLNQDELSERIDPFLRVDSYRENLHNQLIFAIYGNVFRDPPEPGVATWVSANDKPVAVSKPSTGDATEQRLKQEVLQLLPRERRRLKAIQDEPFDMFTRTMADYHNARQIKPPDVVPASAGGVNKTNWDLEIRKRYAQPLFSETNEFPDADTIQARMVPICYEEGIPNGSATGCAEFLNIATETFIKEALSDFLCRVRSNGENYIKTAAYKKRLEKEEGQLRRKEIERTPAGLLPIDAEVRAKRKPLSVHDLRLCLEMGDSYIGQLPLLAGQIVMGAGYLDPDDYDARHQSSQLSKVNGINGFNGIHKVNGRHAVQDIDMTDTSDWGWPGGAPENQDALDFILDECLAIGQ